MWKKAEGFFDSVGWNGNSTFGRTISHNLGVVPEMIWVKCRSHNEDWYVYHKDIDVNSDNQPWTDYIKLNSYVGAADGNIWADTAPTDSVFSVGNQSYMNATNRTYLSYLFATSPGVSKVGSYTGTTASQIIDCGFTAGARFLLIKPLSSGYYWFIFDVERGITTTSNDGAMYLSASQQQYTESYALGYNAIEPDNSGFKLPSNNATNKNGENYIFYAIA
jgi:hypothetical protein